MSSYGIMEYEININNEGKPVSWYITVSFIVICIILCVAAFTYYKLTGLPIPSNTLYYDDRLYYLKEGDIYGFNTEQWQRNEDFLLNIQNTSIRVVFVHRPHHYSCAIIPGLMHIISYTYRNMPPNDLLKVSLNKGNKCFEADHDRSGHEPLFMIIISNSNNWDEYTVSYLFNAMFKGKPEDYTPDSIRDFFLDNYDTDQGVAVDKMTMGNLHAEDDLKLRKFPSFW